MAAAAHQLVLARGTARRSRRSWRRGGYVAPYWPPALIHVGDERWDFIEDRAWDLGHRGPQFVEHYVLRSTPLGKGTFMGSVTTGSRR